MLNRSRLTIKFLLTSIVSVLAAIILGLGLYGFFSTKTMTDNIVDMYENRLICLYQLAVVEDAYADIALAVVHNDLAPEATNKLIDDRLERIEKEWKDYTGTYLLPDEKLMAQETEGFMKAFNEAVVDAKKSILAQDKEAIEKVADVTRNINNVLNDSLGQLMDLQKKVGEEKYNHS